MAPGGIPSCCLTSEQKDALIDAVRARPVIWDCTLDAYQEVQNRRAAFAEVAELLSDDKTTYTGPEMQVEWKDIFNRTLKKVVSQCSGTDVEITWRYWQKLQFISDHERCQIYKAMHKWSKKMPSLPPPSHSSPLSLSTTDAASPPASRRRSSRPTRRSTQSPPLSVPSPLAADNTLSMVQQQLADVAQNARKFLEVKTDNSEELEEEQEQLLTGNSGREAKEEEGEGGGGDQQGEESIGETLGQILLLSSQMVENGGRTVANNGNGINDASEATTSENDLPMRFLLNEWLKGSNNNGGGNGDGAMAATPNWNNKKPKGTTNGAKANGGNNNSGVVIKDQNNRHSHPSPPAPKRQRCETVTNEENGGGEAAVTKRTVAGGGTDQFDVFGMFIASQVRTLSFQSPHCALRLKRSITDLCFQFEAEQNQQQQNI